MSDVTIDICHSMFEIHCVSLKVASLKDKTFKLAYRKL